MPEDARLSDADWLHEPVVQRIFAILDGAAGRTRIVGGAVRNAVLGMPVADLDFATSLVPDEVIARVQDAGLRAVPTGIEHGTVTVVIAHRGFEVTTLRKDVETDGRHAVVAFTDDWAADAARRDFTMNALYADENGAIFDLVGGLDDARRGRVRFIGDPVSRIREDYLRILRFFRMHAWYGRGAIERTDLDAVTAEKAGLERLSAERVGREFLRLLAAPQPLTALTAMADASILAAILGQPGDLGALSRLVEIEATQALNVDAVLRLGVLIKGADLRDRLRLSNAEAKRIGGLSDARLPRDERDARALIVEAPECYADRLLVAWAHAGQAADDPRLSDFLALANTYNPPSFPVGGRDALIAGVPEGPKTGAALDAARRAWTDSDFTADRETLIGVMTDWMKAEAT